VDDSQYPRPYDDYYTTALPSAEALAEWLSPLGPEDRIEFLAGIAELLGEPVERLNEAFMLLKSSYPVPGEDSQRDVPYR